MSLTVRNILAQYDDTDVLECRETRELKTKGTRTTVLAFYMGFQALGLLDRPLNSNPFTKVE